MDADTPLLRQVHPNWIVAGRVTSQLFSPTPKDEGMLSVYDGDRISAANSWVHYTQDLGLQSSGVMAVTLGECQGYEVTAIADPSHFPEHVLLDFRPFSRNKVRDLAKRLTRLAADRGWQYQPLT